MKYFFNFSIFVNIFLNFYDFSALKRVDGNFKLLKLTIIYTSKTLRKYKLSSTHSCMISFDNYFQCANFTSDLECITERKSNFLEFS